MSNDLNGQLYAYNKIESFPKSAVKFDYISANVSSIVKYIWIQFA